MSQIEQATNRTVTIAMEPTPDNLAKCLPQLHSPLFRLPAELRNLIFVLSTQPYWRLDYQYNIRTDFSSCPGHEVGYRFHTGLLRTCRRAWLEAGSLPLAQAEHLLLFNVDRQEHGWPLAESCTEAEDQLRNFLACLTYNRRANPGHVRFFAQPYTLENYRDRGYSSVGKAMMLLLGNQSILNAHPNRAHMPLYVPQIFTLTVRHDDFQGLFELWSPSDYAVQSVMNVLLALGVQTFRLELATQAPERATDEILPTLEQLKMIDGPEWRYTLGPVGFEAGSVGDGSWFELQEGWEERSRSELEWVPNMRLDFRAFTLTWKRRVPEPAEDTHNIHTIECETDDRKANVQLTARKRGYRRSLPVREDNCESLRSGISATLA